MDARLDDVLHGREGNALLPFLWMRAGHRAELPALVERVFRSGTRALCVESRTHEDFCGPEWWRDMDVVMAACEARGMRVWLLDDKRFPTGYANGLRAAKYPDLAPVQLLEHHVDFVGPARQRAMLLPARRGDELLGVFAYRRTGAGEELEPDPIDLTPNVRGRYVRWDVPAGVHRVFAFFRSRRGNMHPDYVHVIDRASVHALLEAVYEPHFAHYGAAFGKTFAGFFSDEPCFGNCKFGDGCGSADIYDQRLGQPGLALPWSAALPERMRAILGRDPLPLLAGLWFPLRGDAEPALRTAFMDAATALYRDAFCMQLGDWARAHGVEYIGHVIEDNNCHARLGHGAGHYFRALEGQDMAGIDVVLHQILPGMAHHVSSTIASSGAADTAFFHYVLARLAASLSHLAPRMRGRAMCEIFGAYGWAESVPLMRRLLDHMLVRGINRFVPHAFSPDYPDPDCPPHFGAGGGDPTFPAFARLLRYANQVVHLFGDAREVVSAALLYHAEAEWSGRPCMLVQTPAVRLADAQLAYDIVPADVLLADAAAEPDGALRAGPMRYPVLLVPAAAWLPAPLLARLRALAEAGARIAFVDARPAGFDACEVVPLDGVAAFVRTHGGADLALADPFPLLRLCHYRREGLELVMAVNESDEEDFEGTLRLPFAGEGLLLRLLEERTDRVRAPGGALPLRLARGESAILLAGPGAPPALAEPAPALRPGATLEAGWTLTLRAAFGRPCDAAPRALERLFDVTGPEGDDGFSGVMRYATAFEDDGRSAALDLGLVGDCSHVRLNGRDLGWRVAPPYRYDLRGAVRPGRNELVVEVANALVRQQPDVFSTYLPIPPSGLLGPVRTFRGFSA